MPLNFSRKIAGKARSRETNRHLGLLLALVAGTVNAWGFLAVHQYTSHVTGLVSAMAGNAAAGAYGLALNGLIAVFSFLFGAVCSAVLLSYSNKRNMQSEYALPLLIEGFLLISLALTGMFFPRFVSAHVFLVLTFLSFVMGLQNALVTKLSNAEIRTTHVTGIITDIGIEIGLWLSSCRPSQADSLQGRREYHRLKVLSELVAFFFLGGLLGTFGFKKISYFAFVPAAFVLISVVTVPIADDLLEFSKRRRNNDVS